MRRQNLFKDVMLAIVLICLFFLICARLFTIVDQVGRDRTGVNACKQRLIIIHRAISLYNLEYGCYPEKLRDLNKHYPEFPPKFLLCPNVLEGNDAHYRYESEIDRKFQGKTPIVWDKRGFHENYGNVLFQDGSIKSLGGNKWEKFLEKVKRHKTGTLSHP